MRREGAAGLTTHDRTVTENHKTSAKWRMLVILSTDDLVSPMRQWKRKRRGRSRYRWKDLKDLTKCKAWTRCRQMILRH